MERNMERYFASKDPKEIYEICFDFSYVLNKWERLLNKSTVVSAIDITDNSDVTNEILDPPRQRITRKKIFLTVRGGVVGHSYRFSCEVIRTNKGTRLSPLTGIMKVEQL